VRTDPGWASAQWPATPGPSDVTKWHYYPETGLLNWKEDAAMKRVSYSYTYGGRLEVRTWARTINGAALTTTYAYDPKTGEMTLADYSDATPDVSIGYDRVGRLSYVLDALGRRDLGYTDALQFDTEAIAGSLYNRTLKHSYESAPTGGLNGRYNGPRIGTEYGVTYGYDAVGRIGSFGWSVSSPVGSVGSGLYTYNSDLPYKRTLGSLVTTYTYEPSRDPCGEYREQVRLGSSVAVRLHLRPG